MGKHIYRAVLLASVAALMVLIFGFSGQTGEESGGLSAILTEPLTELIVSGRSVSPQEREEIYLQVDFYVRKTAHFCEYALLGLLLTLLLRSFGKMSVILPLICGVLYAVTDELHQLYVPQRAGKMEDVLLDAFGVLCGAITVKILNRFRRNG